MKSAWFCPIYTLATVSYSLPQLIRNMAAAVTRKSLMEFKQQLNDDNDCVIISSDIFTRILDENKQSQDTLVNVHQQMIEIQRSTNEVLTRIATALESKNASSNEQSTSLITKMDDLISKISASNATLSTTPPPITDENLKQLINKKCNKQQQIRRSNELSEYFTELLAMSPPYAHRQYRTKVNRNTPEYEKKILSDNTIHKVNQQIQLMQERVKNWTDEMESMQVTIDDTLQHLDENRVEKFNKNMKEESDKQLNEWTDRFASYKRTVSKDIESGASQYLLKYADEKDSENEDDADSQQKNPNSRENQPRGGRGGRGPNRFRGNNSKRNFNNNNGSRNHNNNNGNNNNDNNNNNNNNNNRYPANLDVVGI